MSIDLQEPIVAEPFDTTEIGNELCQLAKLNITREIDGQHVELENERVTIHLDDDWVPRCVTCQVETGPGYTPTTLKFSLVGMKGENDFIYEGEIFW